MNVLCTCWYSHRKKKKFLERRSNLRITFFLSFVVYDFHENVPLFVGKVTNPSIKSGIAGPCSVRTSSEEQTCSRYTALFANALDNANICDSWKSNQVWSSQKATPDETNGEMCERSYMFVKKFYNNNCQSHWCGKFKEEKVAREEEWSRSCNQTLSSETGRLHCTDIKNHIKTSNLLNC